MKKAITKLLIECKQGKMAITDIVIDVVLACALIPVISEFVTDANLSGTEATLLGMTTLFIVLALIFNIGKQTGLIKK